MGSITTESPQYDALIIGAGFGGCYTLHKLREAGFKTIVLDDAADLGGVWYWNCYAGARVDTKVPLYEFSEESIWRDWTWTVKYPGTMEIRKYFEHVENKLHLKKDIQFNTRVVGAEWDEANNLWRVRDANGVERTARYFVLCTGFAAKPFIPDFKGLDTFKGVWCHTSKWPQEGIDFKGKKVGIVGNGSSGLQVIQEVAPDVEHLTVFQRNPTYALPMRQGPLSKEDQDKSKYANLYQLRRTMFTGLDREFNPKSAVEVSDEERNEFFENIWTEGGLSFWLATYADILRNKDSNRYAYEFWRSKVLPRIKDPKKAELLAPEKAPYYFGTKRATLEQRYYEVYNQENVDLIDAKANPISQVVSNGVITADGVFRELDVLVLATGFDSVTGGILAIDIKGVNGESLKEKWAKGTYTNLGLMTGGFPNMMFLYGPQGPTSFCNGPTCAEIQGDWILNTIEYMREHGKIKLDTKKEAEDEWRALVNMIGDATLLPLTNSEYMGTNIPGKPKEMLNYLGGLVDYTKRITSTIELGFPGFIIQ
ncbi:FAD/NAD(P)-binding domain-containing protein [Lepidopterella palustris CBS 459.81]|uniref:FAD/NAD(P)-binding domain-containing protein n=1 Tax=Lepidopterella palustris CBS 459.81 TaxID=1314670 RepID=A0A8E2E391_9PEZI|nr:FAD/NAD(P)-binding domain-containing protein [Lepidopterella palustris CBS 459.81]